MTLIDGDSGDLTEVAKAAWAWGRGLGLEEMREVAPFLRLSGRFEVPDHDPVRLVESEWRHLRAEAGEVGSPEYRALVEAAYEKAVLRGLYPFTSHGALRSSRTTRPGLDVGGPWLQPQSAGLYMVNEGPVWGSEWARAWSVREAVALAVRRVPRGIGPVAAGNSE
ncbi:DUF6193 family natural product biosynthesis protein [Streptomyces sp. ODS05-4]|uniref:DUF6193 family natural product biosynthesis protein n=1 Tax=Streptomyces sp. ODS05-4 TaxID=2944939 RepID=UPI0027E53175|nr:DUF6193 family natural product biosynthesis protein [Streptomyces sp. ODS05-4]